MQSLNLCTLYRLHSRSLLQCPVRLAVKVTALPPVPSTGRPAAADQLIQPGCDPPPSPAGRLGVWVGWTLEQGQVGEEGREGPSD